MREIKFRVYDKRNKRWFYWDTADGGNFWEMCRANEWHDICEYTGLKDINGKEIYEGDIVKWYDDYKYVIDYIAYEDGCFCQYDGAELYRFNHLCEIIGNIHENPELIKGLNI